MHAANLKLKQTGATLILMAFIIGLAATVYLLKAYDPTQLKLEQDKKTYFALNEAKQALIAWAVSHPTNPGQMPLPDRNGEVIPNYDGFSDCPPSNTPFNIPNSYALLIGQLPIYGQGVPCVAPLIGLGGDFYDGQGNRLWYAVSRNLVHHYEFLSANPNSNPIINPSIIDSSVWLKVLDENGTPISNRVAAVIISPGTTIGAQNRMGAANVDNYLDTFKIGSVTFSNSNYIAADEDFVINTKNVDVNDKLVYITIDELMYALEKRVLEEAKNKLTTFYKANNYYPFAAGLGLTANQNQCVQGNHRGLLPVIAPANHTCNCAAAVLPGVPGVCNCSFSIVRDTSFTKDSGTFVVDGAGINSPTGACSVSLIDPKTCTCTAAGDCKNASGVKEFECNACGSCRAAVAGVNKFTSTGNLVSPPTSACVASGSQIDCDNASDATFDLAACNSNEVIKSVPNLGGLLPAWFMANQWEKYIIYAVSSDCVSSSTCESNISPPKISVGLNFNVNAIVAGSLANPNNSCNISSYLSSSENVNLQINNGTQDSIYQLTQPKTLLNTDQLVTVP